MSEIPRDREFDAMLASLLFASLVLHFGFVLYLHQLDWPREADNLPDQYWHLLPPRAAFTPPKTPPQPAHPPPGTHGSKSPASPGRAAGGRRPGRGPAALGEVAVLRALGDGGIGDMLKAGRLEGDEMFGKIDAVATGGGPRLKGGLEIGSKREGTELRARGPQSVSVGGRGEERTVTPRVEITPPPLLRGGLPRELIVAAIRDRLGGIRACYQGPLNHDHGLAGKVTLRFAVETDGRVRDVDVEEDTLGSAEVVRCMKARIASWRFPAAPRPSEFSFPFVFQGSD